MAIRTIPIALLRLCRRLRQDERGAIFVFVAVTITALLLTSGLAVDTGAWYALKRQNQTAADAAAVSAAYRIIARRQAELSVSASDLVPAANQAATLVNGYTGDTPVVNYPYSGNNNWVETQLEQEQGTWFASLAGLSSVRPLTRAVASVNSLPAACLLALSEHGDEAINVQGGGGGTNINIPGCSIVANSDSDSSIHLQGSSSINASALTTAGNIDYTGSAYSLTLDNPPQTGSNPVADPYASTLTHDNLINGMPGGTSCATTCTKTGTTWSGNCILKGDAVAVGETLSANTRICGPSSGSCNGKFCIKNDTVNLSPGVYWITDADLVLQSGSGATLTCPTCTNGGAGVTLIFTSAAASGGFVGGVTLESNANLNLNAPNTQTAAGFNNAGKLLIQDSSGTTFHDFTAASNSTATLSGLLYFPKSTVHLQAGATPSGPQCFLVVANKIDLQGGPQLSTSGCSNLGLNTLPQPYTVSLIQ
jgi:hypothetical protein